MTTVVGREVRHLHECDSTNRVLLQLAAEGAREGLVVVADVQTAGRGRRGRTWTAPAGTSLLCSVLLRPSMPRRTWSLLSLAAGVAVHRLATSLLPSAEVALKWPNDLLIDGVKAAGILMELAADAVVLGIGLNVDWRGVQRPPDLQATSLAEHGAEVSVADATAALLPLLDEAYRTVQDDPAAVLGDYLPRCGTLGREVRVHRAAGDGEALRGTAVALTPDGHLQVRDASGVTTDVQAGDVEHLRDDLAGDA